MVNQIVAAVVGGFLGWSVIQLVSYFVVKSRLKRYLVVQVNARLQSAHSNREWLQKMSEDHSKTGVTPVVAPRFSPDQAEDLHASRELILKYLSRSEVERVTKFLVYHWEAEYLTEGVCEAIRAYAVRKEPLNPDDCGYLSDKVARVTSIISKWPASVQKLEDLPNDYAGVQGPGAVKVAPKWTVERADQSL